MKAWVQISRSDEWFRASSVIAGVLTIPLVYAISARMGNRRAGLVARSYWPWPAITCTTARRLAFTRSSHFSLL